MMAVRSERIAATIEAPRPERKTYYEVLGVGQDATAREIKLAFRNLARRYHPDRNPLAQASDRFKEISEAYEVLSDPARRVAYDQSPAIAGSRETAIAVRDQAAVEVWRTQEPRLTEPARFWPRVGAFTVDFVACMVIWMALSTYVVILRIPLVLLPFLLIMARLAYFAVFWKIYGQTPGKRLFRLKVVSTARPAAQPPEDYPTIPGHSAATPTAVNPQGGPLRWAQALRRALIYSLVFVLFDYINPLAVPQLFILVYPTVIAVAYSTLAYDPQKRAWHDKVAETRVVRVEKK